MITLIPEANPTEYTESTLNVSKALSTPDDGINMDDTLDTNEELIVPTKLLQPKASEIKDGKSVVWNKSEKVQTVQSPTRVITTSHPKPVDPNIGDPKGSSIVMNPAGPQKTAMKRGISDALSDDMEFADELADKEKYQKHPILGKKPLPQNKEVDLITGDEAAEQRRKSHPILGKKVSKEQEGVDFI